MERKYFWGYPRAALGRIGFNIFLGSLFVGPLLFFSGLGTFAYINLLRLDGLRWSKVLYLCILVPIFILSACMAILSIIRFFFHLRCKRLPVSLKAYRRGSNMAIPDPRDSRNCYGAALARHCFELDQIAEKAGGIPLYELGVRKENKRETQWFSSAIGLETVDALLKFLNSPDCQMPDGEELQNDLKMLRAVLEKCDSFFLMLV